MTRRRMVWLVVAVVFTAVNFVAGVVAAAEGEPLHAALHAGLLLLGAYSVWRLSPARYGSRIGHHDEVSIAADSREFTDRLTRLEQSIDSVAIEVERVGEGQRFMTGLFADGGIPRPISSTPISSRQTLEAAE